MSDFASDFELFTDEVLGKIGKSPESSFLKYQNGGRGVKLFASMVDEFIDNPNDIAEGLIYEFHSYLVGKGFKPGTKSALLLEDSWSRYNNFIDNFCFL